MKRPKYKNTYRIESTRLKNYDYSNAGWYYITINTKNHIEWFDEIKNGAIKLNEIGKIVEAEWIKTSQIRDNVEIDYYVIMPNHIHGIIILNEMDNVETRPATAGKRSVSLQYENKFSRPIKDSLPIIINQFKSSVKRWCNKNGYSNFQWQSRFYEHIIRNEKELKKTRRYINENALKWSIEKNIPENLDYTKNPIFQRYI